MLEKKNILGVVVTSENQEKVLEYTLQRLESPSKKFFITTPNPEMVVFAQAHPEFKHILSEAEVALPDGVGLFLASKLLGDPLKDRITGVDFIEMLCKKCERKPLSIGFLGARSGVAQRTAECLKKKYPWIKVAFVGDEWPTEVESGKLKKESFSKNEISKFSTLNSQFSTRIDILFVAFGFPKQEEWIYKNLDKLPVTAAMGVGGAFDYISGEVMRAPKFIRAIGLEWLFRLIRQPWRIKRQLALVKFVSLMMEELLKKKAWE